MPLVETVTALRRTMHRLLTRRLAPQTEWTLLHLRALRVISMGEATTQAELADALLIDPSAVSRLVDRLVDDGLLVRGEGRDRRSFRLVLTPAGKHQLGFLTAELAQIDRQAKQHLSSEDLATLLRLMETLRAALADADERGAAS
jgi:MarR family transcriptional regulator, transcriptional regulator for hemolysin